MGIYWLYGTTVWPCMAAISCGNRLLFIYYGNIKIVLRFEPKIHCLIMNNFRMINDFMNCKNEIIIIGGGGINSFIHVHFNQINFKKNYF